MERCSFLHVRVRLLPSAALGKVGSVGMGAFTARSGAASLAPEGRRWGRRSEPGASMEGSLVPIRQV